MVVANQKCFLMFQPLESCNQNQQLSFTGARCSKANLCRIKVWGRKSLCSTFTIWPLCVENSWTASLETTFVMSKIAWIISTLNLLTIFLDSTLKAWIRPCDKLEDVSLSLSTEHERDQLLGAHALFLCACLWDGWHIPVFCENHNPTMCSCYKSDQELGQLILIKLWSGTLA